MFKHLILLNNVKTVRKLLPVVQHLQYGSNTNNQHRREFSHCHNTRSTQRLLDKPTFQTINYTPIRCESTGMFLIDDAFVSCAEAYFLFIHSLGLEWWLAIPAAAIPMRIGMSLVIGRILMPKFERLHMVDFYLEKRWHFYIDNMKQERSRLHAAGYRTPEQLGQLVMDNLRADRKRYLMHHGCRPSVILVTSLLPLPLWLTMTSALRRIGGIPSWRDWYYRMHEIVPDKTMMTEGCLWFTDLSAADPYHILPVFTSAIFLLATEFTAINNTNVTGYMKNVWRTLLIFSRCWLILFVILCWNMPAAVGYYWVVSAMTALGINVSATFNKRLHLLIRGFPCPHQKPFEEFLRKARKHYGFSKDIQTDMNPSVPVTKEDVLKALRESTDPFALIKARLKN